MKAPVAVLIDSMTASSGEFTAISFAGMKKAQFFGNPSAGYSTSNATFPLSDGSLLLLATAYMADRNKKIYPNGIVPNNLMAPVAGSDAALVAALAWVVTNNKQ